MTAGKPRLLDLFCCEGGAAMGYSRAGFEVVGVDIEAQPRYPFQFIRADAMSLSMGFLAGFDAIHASPPCQAHSNAQRIRGNSHPDLIAPTRALLRRSGRPYVIENVDGAPLESPITLCGAMFGLRTYRHRLFESNVPMDAPPHPEHAAPTTKMGRPVKPGTFMHVVGNFHGADLGRQVMEMPWASRNGLREAIPPAYTEYVGRRLLSAVGPRGVLE